MRWNENAEYTNTLLTQPTAVSGTFELTPDRTEYRIDETVLPEERQ